MTLDDLKAQREAINQQIQEMEKYEIADLQERAARFGLVLAHAENVQKKRGRKPKNNGEQQWDGIKQ